MTRDEAKREVMRLYNTEYLTQAGGLEHRNDIFGAIPFYLWLQQNHPKVLTFSFPGDRYKMVKLWVGAS